MKTIIASFVCMFFVLSLGAQENIQVKIQQRPSSKGIKPCFEVAIPQATSKDAIKLWEKALVPPGILNVFKKTPKLEKQKDEWVMSGVEVSQVSAGAMNVIARFTELKDRVFVMAFFEANGIFIGEQRSADTASASAFVRDYALTVYRDAVEKELSEEKRKLKDLERGQKKYENQKSSYEARIKDLKSDQLTLEAQLKEQRMRLNSDDALLIPMSGSGQTASPGDLKARQEALQKEVKSNEKDLNKIERKISQNEKKIRQNLRSQSDILSKIESQKAVVRGVEQKLRNIR